MEPSLRAAPPEPIWAETPKLSAVGGKKNDVFSQPHEAGKGAIFVVSHVWGILPVWLVVRGKPTGQLRCWGMV